MFALPPHPGWLPMLLARLLLAFGPWAGVFAGPVRALVGRGRLAAALDRIEAQALQAALDLAPVNPRPRNARASLRRERWSLRRLARLFARLSAPMRRPAPPRPVEAAKDEPVPLGASPAIFSAAPP